MRVGDKRVIGPKHRCIQRCGVSADFQSGSVRKRLQARQCHLTPRRQGGSDAFLLAALCYGGGVGITDDEADRHAAFGSGGQDLGEPGRPSNRNVPP